MDEFCQNQFVFDLEQIRDGNQNHTLVLDNEVEFTREYYDQPVKHGVQNLDERVFQIYTKSLLHSRQAIKKYEKNDVIQYDKTEINIHSFASLIQATNVDQQYVDQVFEILQNEELEMKYGAIEILPQIFMLQFPGVYVPKLMKQQLNKSDPQLQFKILQDHIQKLCKFEHLRRNPVLKVYLDVKSDLKQTLKIILKQYRDQDHLDSEIKLYDLADRLRDYFSVPEIKKNNESNIQDLKSKLEGHLTSIKSIKIELKTLIEQKCIHEAGSNILSQALTNKTVSRNEVHEMKEYDNKSIQGVINHETFYYSLKQLGLTLGLSNQKFMDINPTPVFLGHIMRQKEDIGNRILKELLDQEINDLTQMLVAIKQIEQFIRQKKQIKKSLYEVKTQYDKLIFGGSAISSHEQKLEEKKGIINKIWKRQESIVSQPEEIIVQIDQDHVENLEQQIEFFGQQYSAIDIICQILTQNMLQGDFVQYSLMRQQQFSNLVSQISLSGVTIASELNYFYEKLLKILR